MKVDNTAVFINQSGQLYRETLLNNIVPFWMRHGYDARYGGISNVLDDTGNPLSHDKYLWSQGRALWTFSALYHRVEKRAEWKDFADHIYNYLSTHGRDETGKWMYRLDAQGNVLEGDISIYVDGFVLNGLAEYYAATNHEPALLLALETYGSISGRLNSPSSYGVAPYTIPQGMKTHGVAMIFSFFFNHLGEIARRPDIQQHGLQLAYEILDDFFVPEKDVILEFVTIEGSSVDSAEGRACVPGHAIEAMWFLLSIFEQTNDTERMKMCCRLIRRHLEIAWDDVYGGLHLALDVDGQEPAFWKNADGKPWWVHVEALVATAYAYAITGESWCLEWHCKVQQYAFSHYPVASGEWTQWLDRTGKKTQSSALAVKDPFHLPRGLIYLMDLFERRLPEPL